MISSLGANAQIKVNSNGNIGLGCEPHVVYNLKVDGYSYLDGSVNVEGNTTLNQLEFQHPGCGDGFITGNNGSNETSLEPDEPYM
ncbi:MAG: hypothetical protein PF436_00895 [Prolixibacteraceae bacterium]|nr:hypothetical protein [Prolixibacteraceae bacterium]